MALYKHFISYYINYKLNCFSHNANNSKCYQMSIKVTKKGN